MNNERKTLEHDDFDLGRPGQTERSRGATDGWVGWRVRARQG
jgi:hypothetical protein